MCASVRAAVAAMEAAAWVAAAPAAVESALAAADNARALLPPHASETSGAYSSRGAFSGERAGQGQGLPPLAAAAAAAAVDDAAMLPLLNRHCVYSFAVMDARGTMEARAAPRAVLHCRNCSCNEGSRN